MAPNYFEVRVKFYQIPPKRLIAQKIMIRYQISKSLKLTTI